MDLIAEIAAGENEEDGDQTAETRAKQEEMIVLLVELIPGHGSGRLLIEKETFAVVILVMNAFEIRSKCMSLVSVDLSAVFVACVPMEEYQANVIACIRLNGLGEEDIRLIGYEFSRQSIRLFDTDLQVIDRLVFVDDGPLNKEALFQCESDKGEIERGDTRH